jgi:hypothetical protein
MDRRAWYGIFSVGLFIYDYEYGKIDWYHPSLLYGTPRHAQ